MVAPHPDDEVFGCGGLIAMKRELGARVDVAILTNGEGSHRKYCDTPEREIAGVRRELAHRASAVLGLAPDCLHWLDFPDGGVPRKNRKGFDEAAGRLAMLVCDVRPTEVYCPHPMEVWSGDLPRDFLRAFDWPYELFFETQTDETRRST